jgi:DNA-directed RNA polymerase I subunit RPA49
VPFTIYSRDSAPTTSDITKQRTLIAGETEDVEFFSTNRDRQVSAEGSDCQYLAAVYDPETNKLHVTSTPLYLLAHRVKRLRDQGPSGTASLDQQWKAKRNDLGEVFGTRKAKSQIKAEERNKVDVNAMSGVRSDLISSIAAKEAADDTPAPPEVIPVPNLTTTNIAEVYPREAIVPDNEWSALNVTEIVKAKDDKERVACLPYRRSRWIENKLRVAVEGPASVRKQNL